MSASRALPRAGARASALVSLTLTLATACGGGDGSRKSGPDEDAGSGGLTGSGGRPGPGTGGTSAGGAVLSGGVTGAGGSLAGGATGAGGTSAGGASDSGVGGTSAGGAADSGAGGAVEAGGPDGAADAAGPVDASAEGGGDASQGSGGGPSEAGPEASVDAGPGDASGDAAASDASPDAPPVTLQTFTSQPAWLAAAACTPVVFYFEGPTELAGRSAVDPAIVPSYESFGVLFQPFTGTTVYPSILRNQQGQIALPGHNGLLGNTTSPAPASNLDGRAIKAVFTVPVHAFGVHTNVGDGGYVEAFDAGGQSIQQASISSGGFGGITSPTPIARVSIVNTFNSDIRFGIYGFQFCGG